MSQCPVGTQTEGLRAGTPSWRKGASEGPGRGAQTQTLGVAGPGSVPRSAGRKPPKSRQSGSSEVPSSHTRIPPALNHRSCSGCQEHTVNPSRGRGNPQTSPKAPEAQALRPEALSADRTRWQLSYSMSPGALSSPAAASSSIATHWSALLSGRISAPRGPARTQ